MRVQVALVAVGLAAGLALVACGGSARMSKAQYSKALKATFGQMQSEMKSAYAPLYAGLIPKGGSEASTCSIKGNEVVCSHGGGSSTLSRAARLQVSVRVGHVFRRAAARLAALTPPANVAADNQKLVAGLRAVASFYSIYFAAHNAKQGEALAKAILHSAAVRESEAAGKDLIKKGYKVGSLSDSSPIPSTEPSTSSVPIAKAINPLPFALVSQAGTQPASNLTASVCAAKPSTNKSGVQSFSSCSIGLSSESSSGPIPSGLSVVRPGERVQFTGPALAHVFKAGVPMASGWVDKLCNGLGLPVKSVFLQGTSWALNLKPGAYVLSLSFSWDSPQGAADESGDIGLLVSRTEPLRVLPKPRCSS